MKFHPNLAADVFALIDVQIRFWGQGSKVKVTASNDPINVMNTIFLK